MLSGLYAPWLEGCGTTPEGPSAPGAQNTHEESTAVVVEHENRGNESIVNHRSFFAPPLLFEEVEG
jgi:hypothetical protein